MFKRALLKLPTPLWKRSISSWNSKESDILFESFYKAGKITFNRPENLNAVNTTMIIKLHDQLRKWEMDKSLIILKGSGGKAFCVGGDLKTDLRPSTFRTGYSIIYFISKYKIPFVSLIDGYTMGGGLGMSVAGRYRIATENTIVSMPENKVGFSPDCGSTYFLPRIKHMIGFYLGLTGEALKGNDAVTTGLATHYVPSNHLNDLEIKLSQCSNAKDINALLGKFSEVPKDLSLEPHLKDIEYCFSAPSVENILERLSTVKTDWSMKTIKKMNRLCPGSLKITLKAFQKSAHLNLKECLQMEYRLSIHALEKHDFHEGVRAILVDKDNNPKWNPSSLSEVTDNYVESFFAKLPEENELKLT